MLNVKSLQHCSIFPILPPILCSTVVIHSLLLLHIANPIIQLLYTYIYIYNSVIFVLNNYLFNKFKTNFGKYLPTH